MLPLVYGQLQIMKKMFSLVLSILAYGQKV